jgi:hypothetical protein
MRSPKSDEHLAELRDVVARKHKLKPVYVRVHVARQLAGATSAFLGTAFLQELLSWHPEWADNLLAVRESLFALRPNSAKFPPLTGETVFAVKAWDLALVLPDLLSPDARARPLASKPTFAVRGLAEGFRPGAYTRLGLHLALPADHFDDTRGHLERYLRAAYLPYSLRRQPDEHDGRTRYGFEVSRKGLKKKLLFAGTFSLSEQGMVADLEIGQNFGLRAFLDTFGDRSHYYADSSITAIQW